MSKLHTNTKCRIINLADMRFEFPKDQSIISVRAFLPDGTLIQPNFYHFWKIFKPEQGLRYFLMDHKEHVKVKGVYEKFKDEEEKFEKSKEYLGSMIKFAKHFKKTIYLRLLPPVTVGNEKDHRVFVDEVLEMIPILMKQQKTPIQENDARLQRHCCQSSHLVCRATCATFTVTELETILNDFDVNKAMITLIPDPCYEMMRREHMQHGAPLRFPAPDMKIVSTMHHSISFLFTTLVVGLNWKVDNCERHEGCNRQLKRYVVLWLREILALGENTCVDAALLLAVIGDHKATCMHIRKATKGLPDLKKRCDESEAFISRYHNFVKFYDLPKYPVFVHASRKDQMPIWEFRVLGTLGWIQQFFGGVEEEMDEEIKRILMECLFFIIPKEHIPAAKEFMGSIIHANVNSMDSQKRGSLSSESSMDDKSTDSMEALENLKVQKGSLHRNGKKKQTCL